MHGAVTGAVVTIVALCLAVSPIAGASNDNGNAYGHENKAQSTQQSNNKEQDNGKNHSSHHQEHKHKDSSAKHTQPAVNELQQPVRPAPKDAHPVKPVEKTTAHKDHKKSQHIAVTICHRTGSATNPYVRITVDDDSITKQGHSQHQDEGDIIPPFIDDNGKQYAGLNWTTEGQATWNNSCNKVAKTPVVVLPLEKPSTPAKPVKTENKPATSKPVAVDDTKGSVQQKVIGLLPQTGGMRTLLSVVAMLTLFALTVGGTYIVRSRIAKQ